VHFRSDQMGHERDLEETQCSHSATHKQVFHSIYTFLSHKNGSSSNSLHDSNKI